MRYFLEISYFGKNYHGWQRQPEAITIQEILEGALSTLLREDIQLTGAGRTDAGVHAKQMMAHFDSNNIADTADFKYRLNAFLPKDIAVYNVHPVNENVHARFDAAARTYEYWINTAKNPFLIDYSYYFYRDMDVEKMNKAARILMEYTDFECFSKKHTDVKTFLCTVMNAEWSRREKVLVFTITADRFLRNMVRAIVGTLLDVGTLKLSLDGFKNIIESKKRENAGVSVPAHGLYLTKVTYPYTIFEK